MMVHGARKIQRRVGHQLALADCEGCVSVHTYQGFFEILMANEYTKAAR